jgi:hypothetical protein
MEVMKMQTVKEEFDVAGYRRYSVLHGDFVGDSMILVNKKVGKDGLRFRVRGSPCFGQVMSYIEETPIDEPFKHHLLSESDND